MNIGENVVIFLNGFVGKNHLLDEILVGLLSDTGIDNALLQWRLSPGFGSRTGVEPSEGD